ncbi:MAG: DAK2 domain-containing protein, partial [Acidimicrobiales bacterium]
LEAVVEELGPADDMDSVCKAISHGSLMGARGHSGVILSQILRGIAEECRRADAVDGEIMAGALTSAADAAYGAVMRPVEGTILTVARAAADGARSKAGAALVDVLDAAKEAAAAALANTPELLPVLKQAGVVDAGGAGFLLLLDALLEVVAGRPIPEPDPTAIDLNPTASLEVAPGEAGHDVGDLRYEVMFFLEAQDETVPRFKEMWAGIGDSIVVVGGDGIWNCHIHTDDIGASIEAALDCGRPKKIRVTDLLEQVEEERWVREAEAAPHEDPPAEPVDCAVVAVATGDGIRRIFRSLGVQQIVAGGQSMNPSTAQILEAVEAVPADEVVILPNNKNIIPVAEQVAPHTKKVVRVIRTMGIAEGFAALLAYDPDADAGQNHEAMSGAASTVVSGEITRAVRDSSCDAGPIAEGDYLGIAKAGITSIAADIGSAAVDLLEVLITAGHEVLTVIEGDGASAAITRHISEWAGEHRPGIDVEVHHGGQPLYPYLFSIE